MTHSRSTKNKLAAVEQDSNYTSSRSHLMTDANFETLMGGKGLLSEGYDLNTFTLGEYSIGGSAGVWSSGKINSSLVC